jgi:hypothetical protein
MTKDEALVQLEEFLARADRLTVDRREVVWAQYEGELHRQRADCYRIAIALVRQIEKEQRS